MNFIEKVQDSNLDIVGRILVFITAVVLIVLLNSVLCVGYKETTPHPVQLFLSFIVGCVGLFCIGLCFTILVLIAVAIGWVFTGEFSDGIWDFANDLLTYTVVFLFMFLYGDWNRQWIKRRKYGNQCDDSGHH